MEDELKLKAARYLISLLPTGNLGTRLSCR